MKVKIVNNAKEATGIAVIIDVFRAFTVEPYIMNNCAKKLIPVGDIEIAYEYKRKDENCILIGERGGRKQDGFEYGNSPSQIQNVDFSGKTVVHTTSCGTQGIVRAVNADEIITGSLVNAKAIAKYIKDKNAEEVSLVSMCRSGEEPAEEDELCAKYIKSLLLQEPMNNMMEEIENLKQTRGARFFDETMQEVFPQKDFYLCTELNKFNFVLRVNKDNNGMHHIEKINV